jgi:hypothetical protein
MTYLARCVNSISHCGLISVDPHGLAARFCSRGGKWEKHRASGARRGERRARHKERARESTAFRRTAPWLQSAELKEHDPMDNQDGIRRELDTTLNELRTLRDEIRLQVHLAGMEVKDRWNRDLEPQLYSLEQRVQHDVSKATHDALHDLAAALRKFRKSMTH